MIPHISRRKEPQLLTYQLFDCKDNANVLKLQNKIRNIFSLS